MSNRRSDRCAASAAPAQRRWRYAVIGLCAVSGVVGSAAIAETPATFGVWTATSATIYGNPECFVIGEPEALGLSKESRNWLPSITITHRPADGVAGEVTIDPGIALDSTEPAAAAVGAVTFELAIESMSQRLLLIADLADERRLVATLRSGALLEVAATAADGRPILDRYDLTGLAQALDAIDEACPP